MTSARSSPDAYLEDDIRDLHVFDPTIKIEQAVIDLSTSKLKIQSL